MKAFVKFAVNFYKRNISPFSPHCCRFHPSCSSYCIDAIDRYGLMKGLWFFVKRIFKCHPLHPGGYDPVEHLDKSC